MSFCHSLRVNKGALFHFREGWVAGTKLELPKEVGTDVRVPLPRMCPHCFPPTAAPHGSPMPVVVGGCGCLLALAGAGGRSSCGPVPHMHPFAYVKGTPKGEL